MFCRWALLDKSRSALCGLLRVLELVENKNHPVRLGVEGTREKHWKPERPARLPDEVKRKPNELAMLTAKRSSFRFRAQRVRLMLPFANAAIIAPQTLDATLPRAELGRLCCSVHQQYVGRF
jgi:hypothetical protein